MKKKLLCRIVITILAAFCLLLNLHANSASAPTTLHHFEIIHDSAGDTCEAEYVTIKACANDDCSVLTQGAVSLDFQITDSSSTTTVSSPTFTGATSIEFNYTNAEPLTLSIANPTITPSNALFCSGGSCNITFSTIDIGTLNAIGIKTGRGGRDTRLTSVTEAQTIYDAWRAEGSPTTGLIDNGNYNVIATGENRVDRIDFGGRPNNFSGTLDYPGNDEGVNDSNFLVYVSGTLSLPAGDYTIHSESNDGFSFTMNTRSGDIVSFDKFGRSTAGASNELRFERTTGNSNTGGSFTLTQDSVFDIKGMFFETLGSDFFEIAIANEILTESASSAPAAYNILKDGALNGKVNFGQCAVPPIHHFEIIHDSAGATCEAEYVTIKACANEDCSVLAEDEVNIDLQITDSSSTTTVSSPTFTGATSIEFNYTNAEPLTLSIANPTIAPSNAVTCSGGSCNITFESIDTGTLNAVGINVSSDTRLISVTQAQTIYDAWRAEGSPSSGLISNGQYNITATGSDTLNRIDFGSIEENFTNTLPFPGNDNGVNGDDILVYVSGTLSLPAGDYTIHSRSNDGFSFTMNTLSGDTVSFTKFGLSTAGAPNELRFEGRTTNSDTGGSFTLTQSSVFNIQGIHFNRGLNQHFEMAITNDLRTSSPPSGYEVLGDNALNGKVNFGQCAQPTLHHFEIIHDGQGITCAPEPLTIKACLNSDCTTQSNEEITLDFQVTNATSTVTKISPTFTGNTSLLALEFNHSVAETLSLSIANGTIDASAPIVCNNSSMSCNITFTDAGFRFLSGDSNSTTIPQQTSGSVFNDALKLQAIKDDGTGVCTGLFDGDIDIELSQENIDPSGITGLNFTVNNNATPIDKHADTTPVTLTFGANSIATIPAPVYNDAGQIRLHANYNVDGVSLIGSSNDFWVSPAELVITATSATSVINGDSAITTITHEAGKNFTLTVSALNSLGDITPNYTPEKIQLSLARTAPITSGSDGKLTYATAANAELTTNKTPTFTSVILNDFSGGTSTFNAAQYSEVGLINLDIQDVNYGNVNNIISGAAINIGRFIPSYFEQTVEENGAFFTTCGDPTAMFAYSNQLEDLAGTIKYLTNPILEIIAYDAQGNVPKNYIAEYQKLKALNVTLSKPTADQTAEGINLAKLPITANINIGTLDNTFTWVVNNGVASIVRALHYQLSSNDNFFYHRSANAKVAPFTSHIALDVDTITDSDGVSLRINNANETQKEAASPTGVQIRFGRLMLENSFGPETSNLVQPLKIEYFDGSNTNNNSFVVSSDDNCSTYDASKITLTNNTLNPSLTEVLGSTEKFVNGETKAIMLKAPGVNNQGKLNVEYNAVDWLKYDWNGDGINDNNPAAIATFGIYRGNDRIISWREVFN